MLTKEMQKALVIAKDNLRSCYGKEGILAGKTHFAHYWARDGFFASFGSIYMKDHEIVKKELGLFMRNMKPNGHLPRVLNRSKMIRATTMWFKKRIPERYIKGFLTFYSRDQNALFVIAFWEYVKKTGDYEYARQNFDKLEKIMTWDFRHDKDRNLLIEEQGFAGWEDSINKKGDVLYTNVCHYKGLLCFSEICDWLGEKAKAKQYSVLAGLVKRQINELFWNGVYYCDFIQNEKRENYFSSGENLLAVYWGLADEKKAKSIFKFIEQHKLEGFTIQSSFPFYPKSMVFIILRMFGLPDYHNGLLWIWVGCVEVLAKLKLGMKRAAKKQLQLLAEKIVEYGSIYEVYERSGKPVKRLFYRSENPFAWSSGLFIYTCEKFREMK